MNCSMDVGGDISGLRARKQAGVNDLLAWELLSLSVSALSHTRSRQYLANSALEINCNRFLGRRNNLSGIYSPRREIWQFFRVSIYTGSVFDKLYLRTRLQD